MPITKGKDFEVEGEEWTVEFLNDTVEAEFNEFSADIQAEFVNIAEMIAEVGLQDVGYPHVAHIGGKIWEMRAKDRDGWGRQLYCTARGKRVVILRGFMKKTNKTPKREIEIATERMKKLK